MFQTEKRMTLYLPMITLKAVKDIKAKLTEAFFFFIWNKIFFLEHDMAPHILLTLSERYATCSELN